MAIKLQCDAYSCHTELDFDDVLCESHLEQIKDEAFEEGKKEGHNEGYEEGYEEARTEFEK